MFEILSTQMNLLITILGNIRLGDLLDIALVSFIFYFTLLFIKQTKSYFLVNIAVLLFIINLLSKYLNLSLTRELFQPISTIIVVIIVVIFQKELRRFFSWIIYGKKFNFLKTITIGRNTASELFDALVYMEKNKIGGIVVFRREQMLDEWIEGGQLLDGRVSKELILSVFDTSSPGHDGAIIIDENKIKYFGVHLPLAKDYSDFRKAGTRHRAGTGITEETDAVAFIVSEERGEVSVAENGKLQVIANDEELRKIIEKYSIKEKKNPEGFWKYFFLKNLLAKISAVGLSLVLWSILVLQGGIIKKEFGMPISFQLLPNNIQVDASISKEVIEVILSGKSSDINNLETKGLEVKIDAKDFKPGSQTINISKQMISVPPFIEVVDFNPKQITVLVSSKTEVQNTIMPTN